MDKSFFVAHFSHPTLNKNESGEHLKTAFNRNYFGEKEFLVLDDKFDYSA